MNKKVFIKYYLDIYLELIFWSTISRDHLQSKIIYLYYSEVRSLKSFTMCQITLIKINRSGKW